MYDDELPSGNQWWRDPFAARKVARWSLPGFAAAGAASALIGGGWGTLLGTAVIAALPVAAFFEARGSLFVLHYATSASAPRRFPPRWWPWFVALVGAVALVFAGGWLSGLVGGRAGDALLAATLAAAGGLFLGGLFTLLGYYLDKELSAWFDRAADEEARETEREAQRAQRRDERRNRGKG